MTAAPVLRSAEEARELLGEEAARTAARHALWRAGDLRYALHTGQRAALAAWLTSDARRFVLCTGRRWGKSRLMCVIAVTVCVLRALHRAGHELPPWVPGWLRSIVTRTTRPARVVYAAPTAGMVAEFIEPHMLWLQAHCPPELRPEHDGLHGRWIFPGGDVIVIRGCEDRKKADRLRGAEADLGIVDEGGFIPILDYVAKSVVGPQLWETRGRMLLPSTPPESPDHPYVGFLAEAEELGASFRARTADAPHITPEMLAEAIKDAGGETSVDWQREGEARIVVDPERTVLPEFTEYEALVVRAVERPRHFLPHVIGDAGFEDCDVLGFGYYDFKADLDVIEDELVMQHARSDTLDAAVAAKERELWGTPEGPPPKVHRRRIDAQPKVRADMSREEWQAVDEEDAVRHWQGVTKGGGPGMGSMRATANAARVRIARGRVAVHPRCKTIIAHAKHARWNTARDAFVRVTDGQGRPLHHYDGAAALVYFLRDLDRAKNPYPVLPEGVSHDDHFIPPALLRKQRSAHDMFFGKTKRR